LVVCFCKFPIEGHLIFIEIHFLWISANICEFNFLVNDLDFAITISA